MTKLKKKFDNLKKNLLQCDLSAVDLKLIDSHGNALLHYAVEDENYDIVDVLLKAGVDVNLKRGSRATSLPQHKHIRAMSIILDKEEQIQQELKSIHSSHDNQNKLPELQQRLVKLEEIKVLLLDHGANRADIGVFRTKIEDLKAIQKRLGISDEQVRISKKDAENLDIVQSCGSGDSDITKIYEDFYMYLKGRLNIAIKSIITAASGNLELKDPQGLFTQTLSVSSPTLLMMIQAKRFLLFENQLANFKVQASHFIDNQHTDTIISDYCARVTSYYRKEIFKEDTDIGIIEKASEAIQELLASARLGAITYFVDLSVDEVKQKYIHDNNIFKKHWEKIADRAVLRFCEFLRDHQVHYREDLGIEAANSVLPSGSFLGQLKFEYCADFSSINAYSLSVVSQMVYEHMDKIKEISSMWHFKYCSVRQSNYQKSVVMYDDHKIVLAFRGTYHHEIHWINNNFNIRYQNLKIGQKDLKVHKGFYNALMLHWEKDSDGEKPIKTILTEYLTTHSSAKVYITGHSLGGAMACIGYLKLLDLRVNETYLDKSRISLYTYGQPKWCSYQSIKIATELFESNYYRIVNDLDIVPHLPPMYTHLGVEKFLNRDGLSRSIEASINLPDHREVQKHSLSAFVLNIDHHLMNKYILKIAQNYFGYRPHSQVASEQELNISAEHYLILTIHTTDKILQQQEETKKFHHIIPIVHQDGFQMIHLAAVYGNIDDIERCVHEGHDINTQTPSGKVPLQLAILNYHSDFAVELLSRGANFENLGFGLMNQTLLEWSIDNRAYNLFKWLFDNNQVPSVDMLDEKQNTLLYKAVSKNCLEIVEFLLNQGVKIDEKCEYGNTPLWRSSYNGYLEIVKTLVDHKCDLNIKNKYGHSPIAVAIDRHNWHIVKLLIDNGAEFRLEELFHLDQNQYCLCGCYVSFSGSKVLYTFNLFIGDNIDIEKDSRLLELSSMWNTENLYSSDVQIGAKYSCQSLYRISDVTEFLEHENKFQSIPWKIVTKTVKFGIEPDSVNYRGNTMLYEMCSKVCETYDEDIKREEDIKDIITKCEVGIDYTKRLDGWTPLHLSVASNQPNIVEILVQYGAKSDLKDLKNQTPLDLANSEEVKNKLKSTNTISIELESTLSDKFDYNRGYEVTLSGESDFFNLPD